MKFRALSDGLRETAERAARYFTENRGLSKIRIEQAVEDFPAYAFTFAGLGPDYQLICLEVSENPYPPMLENFVIDCLAQGAPIMLYSVFPEVDPVPVNYKQRVDRARQHGVGVVEIASNGADVKHEAIPFSLVGYRLGIQRFPRHLRPRLSQAESVFRAGRPDKGCSVIYEEIESISRDIAARTYNKGLWKNNHKLDFKRKQWGPLMDLFAQELDYNKCRSVKKQMIARVLGMIEHRNEAAHKPANRAAARRRDQELRTRFESAADLLLELSSVRKI